MRVQQIFSQLRWTLMEQTVVVFFLGIVNEGHICKYTFHELRLDFSNHSKLQCSTHCIFDLCPFYRETR